MERQKRRYNRPRHPARFFCKRCQDNPDGFRSDHELRRHTKRFHSAVRRIWTTVDISATPSLSVTSNDPSKPILPEVPLAGCRKCDTGKKYGAKYNAAEHLRRQHFKPPPKRRPRGAPNNRNESLRESGAGGRWPPMELLKHWMKEVEEFVEQGERGEILDRNQAILSENTPVTATIGTAPIISLGEPSLANAGSVRPSDIIAPAPRRQVRTQGVSSGHLVQE